MIRRSVAAGLTGLLTLLAGALLIPRIAQTQDIPQPSAPGLPTPGPKPPRPPVAAMPVGLQPNIPHLSEEERARALAIATEDSRVQQLLAGREYSLTSIGVWHTSKDLEKIGAGIIFSLPEPASFELDWLLVDYDESEASFPPYRQVRQRFTLVDVTNLVVKVDLHRGEVIAITAGSSDRRGHPDISRWLRRPPVPH